MLHYLHTSNTDVFSCTDSKLDRRDKLPVINEVGIDQAPLCIHVPINYVRVPVLIDDCPDLTDL